MSLDAPRSGTDGIDRQGDARPDERHGAAERRGRAQAADRRGRGPTDQAYTAHHLEDQRVLTADVGCRPCHRGVCPIDHRCMFGVPVSDVVRAAMELVEGWFAVRRAVQRRGTLGSCSRTRTARCDTAVRRPSSRPRWCGDPGETSFGMCESNDVEVENGEPAAVLLFWSHEAYARRVIEAGFDDHVAESLSLLDFLFRWLPGMAGDGVLAGRTSPSRSTGSRPTRVARGGADGGAAEGARRRLHRSHAGRTRRLMPRPVAARHQPKP